MTQILLAGLGAGIAAALLFASVASRVLLSIFLFYLAPLPIMIVALGWSHWAGLVAAAAAAAMLGAVFGPQLAAIFLTLAGAPAWWLGYLALLGRPLANGATARMEWYPPGRLVLWAAVFGAAVTAAALLVFWGDETTMRQSLKSNLDLIMRPGPDAGPFPAELSGIDADLLLDMMMRVLPPAAAVTASLTQTLNLWLAGQAVRLSGRLQRPWPDLTALSLPVLAAVLYGTSLAGAFLPGLTGIVAGLFAATLTTAFAMVGCAVLHTLTRGLQGRTAILWGTYACVFFLVWPLLVMTVIGVAETLFDLRGRFSRRGPPGAGAKEI
jgi:hypothetical protein